MSEIPCSMAAYALPEMRDHSLRFSSINSLRNVQQAHKVEFLAVRTYVLIAIKRSTLNRTYQLRPFTTEDSTIIKPNSIRLISGWNIMELCRLEKCQRREIVINYFCILNMIEAIQTGCKNATPGTGCLSSYIIRYRVETAV